MNYLSISKVIGMISKLEGSKGALSLGGKQLRMLAKDEKMAQVIGRMAVTKQNQTIILQHSDFVTAKKWLQTVLFHFKTPEPPKVL